MDEKKTDQDETPGTVIYGMGKDRTNDLFWADVYALAGQKAAPTVHDVIMAMCAQGNARFMRDYGFHESHEREKFFKYQSGDVDHEISHICPRLPHVPESEYAVMAFQYGLTLGIKAKDLSEKEWKSKKSEFQMTGKFLKQHEEEYKDKDGKPYLETHPHPPFSTDQTTVYIAAGMYMREKIDALLKQGQDQPLADRTYAKQKEWCGQWSKTDSDPVQFEENKYPLRYGTPYYFDNITNLPAALLDISQDEWQAIENVATGVTDPEETHCPKRLQAIKEALMHTELFSGQSTFLEDVKQKQNQTGKGLT